MKNRPAEITADEAAILRLLQADARQTTAQIAEKLNLSVTPCWRRIRGLEQSGTITGYHARLDPRRVGLGLEAFVMVQISSHKEEDAIAFEEAVRKVAQIVACYVVSGPTDYLLHVVAKDLDAYGEFGRSVIARLPGVREVRSSFVLQVVKPFTALPVGDAAEAA